MKRSFAAAASFVLCASLAGCGSPASVGPNELPALTAEERDQMKQETQKTQDEERAQLSLTPKIKPVQTSQPNARF